MSGDTVIRPQPARRFGLPCPSSVDEVGAWVRIRGSRAQLPAALVRGCGRGRFEQIGQVDDATITEVVRLHDTYQPRADEVTLARINRAREEAARTFGRAKGVAALQATMGRLDAEERIAREPVEARRLTAVGIVDYTRSLPRLWADSGPDGRQAMVTAIFIRLDVLDYQRLEYELTPDAMDLGLDATLPPVVKLGYQIGEFGRGERRQATRRHLNVPANLPLEIEVTGTERWLNSSTA